MYCKTLSNVIREAKRKYDTTIKKSNNKCKTAWDIIKKLQNNQEPQTDIQELVINAKHLKEQQEIAEAFSNYFSSINDKITLNNMNNKTDKQNPQTFHYYLEQTYPQPPPPLVIKTFSTKEITKIIKTLKTKKLLWL